MTAMSSFLTIDRVGIALVVATLVTFTVGESGLAGGNWLPVLFIFALAWGKSALVILHFMELRRAPLLWRLLLLGWLTLVTGGILLAWWLGGQT